MSFHSPILHFEKKWGIHIQLLFAIIFICDREARPQIIEQWSIIIKMSLGRQVHYLLFWHSGRRGRKMELEVSLGYIMRACLVEVGWGGMGGAEGQGKRHLCKSAEVNSIERHIFGPC